MSAINQTDTFNPSDNNSIYDFFNKIHQYDDNNINEQFLIINMEKAVNALKQIKEKDYEDEKTFLLLKVLTDLSFHLNTENILKKVIELGTFTLFSKMIDFYCKLKPLNYDFLNCIFMSLSSYTYCSILAANENIKYNFHQKAIDLAGKILKIDQNDINILSLYFSLINFLHKNSCYSDIREALVCIKQALLDNTRKVDAIIKENNEFRVVKTNLVCTIANILNDKELDELSISQDIVKDLNETLKGIIENHNHNEQIYEKTKYYVTYEIGSSYIINASRHLDKIISIAVNDTIKQKLFNQGILLLLQELLKNGNEIEVQKSAELICSLCFNESAAKYIKDNQIILNKIIEIEKTSSDTDTKQSCQQIIKMVNNSLEKRITSAKVGKKSQHIMISYNHKYKEPCLKICDELKQRGYNTWMDVNSTFNDLHDAMAEAIENASVVLICYSHEYKISNNCRLEAQYAFKLNKNIIPIKLQPKYEPDGWLGMVLATKLYVDFSKDISSSIFVNLTKQIDLFLNKPENEIKQRPSSSQITSVSQTATTARPPSRNISSASKRNETNAGKWTNEEVKNWLNNNNMSSLVDVFKTCTGMGLKALWEMKQKDYTQFGKTIEKMIATSKANVDIGELLNFYGCLQCAFNN